MPILRGLVVNHTFSCTQAAGWERRLRKIVRGQVEKISSRDLADLAGKFDIVLLLGLSADLEQGLRLVERIKEQCGNPSVLVLTHHGKQEVHAQVLKRGANAFLMVPRQSSLFGMTVEELIKNRPS
jgi:FixJ family two-component response regulator